MFLSIIIPHYDLPEELLRRCIDSIVEQETTTFDYEIIVVDDGSATPPVWIKEQYHGITLIESTKDWEQPAIKVSTLQKANTCCLSTPTTTLHPTASSNAFP